MRVKVKKLPKVLDGNHAAEGRGVSEQGAISRLDGLPCNTRQLTKQVAVVGSQNSAVWPGSFSRMALMKSHAWQILVVALEGLLNRQQQDVLAITVNYDL